MTTQIQTTTFKIKETVDYRSDLYDLYEAFEYWLAENYSRKEVKLTFINFDYTDWINDYVIATYVQFNNPEDAVIFKLKFGAIVE